MNRKVLGVLMALQSMGGQLFEQILRSETIRISKSNRRRGLVVEDEESATIFQYATAFFDGTFPLIHKEQCCYHENEIHGPCPQWHLDRTTNRIGALARIEALLQIHTIMLPQNIGLILFASTTDLHIHSSLSREGLQCLAYMGVTPGDGAVAK
jgi:hypothetical protein